MRSKLYLLFFLLFIPTVFAIGISPPSAQLTFIPGQTYEIPVKIINYNSFPIEVVTRTDGPLAKGFVVKQPITIAANSNTVTTIQFTVPQTLSRPGYHTNYVYFKESFLDKQSGTFAVRTEVGLRITVWQPYPGHYAEIVASAPSISEGEDTVLTVLINNLGVEPVAGGKATVRVVSAGGELQDVYTFPNIDVPGNSNQQFYEEIPSATYAPGRYQLQARLEYADNVSEMNGSFIVGTQDIEVLALEGPLYLDKAVNKFQIHLQSLWNLPIENVHGSFELGSGIAQTAPINLQPFGKDSLEGYWETDRSVGEGNPLAHVVINFGQGLQKEAVLPILVYNETPPEPVNVVGEAQEPGVVELSLADLGFMFLALVIVGCLVLIAFKSLRKKDGGGNDGSGPSQPLPPGSPPSSP